MSTQSQRAIRFRELHAQSAPFVIPNVFDAGSAKLLATLGFEALATTSAGLAFGLGRPDGRKAVSRQETLNNCRAIAEATALPVSADLENCFADEPMKAAETIRLAAQVGIVGGSIEDATGDAANPIYDFELAVERVRAAVQVARSLRFPFTLTARAENFLHGRRNIDDTIRRLQAFEQAGADVLFAPGLADIASVRAVVSSVSKPINVLISSFNSQLRLEELAAAGVKRISVGGVLARVALTAMTRAARDIKEHGRFTCANDLLSMNELDALFANSPDAS
jgi:2-methylisocitrate lyase-like PEP mutase family enzyme